MAIRMPSTTEYGIQRWAEIEAVSEAAKRGCQHLLHPTVYHIIFKVMIDENQSENSWPE